MSGKVAASRCIKPMAVHKTSYVAVTLVVEFMSWKDTYLGPNLVATLASLKVDNLTHVVLLQELDLSKQMEVCTNCNFHLRT